MTCTCRNAGGSAGQHKDPEVRSELRNSLGQLIPNNVALAIGDRVQLDITLTKDGVWQKLYSNSMLLRACILKNHGDLPPSMSHMLHLRDLYPFNRQSIMTLS